MKRLLSIVMIVALAMGSLFSAGIALAAPELPSVGDKIHGFTVTEIGTERLVDAPKVLLEHDKTGAKVVYIAANDVNCSFDITFRTPNLNSKGISHVFEHATISGSEKYPSQSLFFPMATQTYNTFANAMTYPSATTYPLASMSEEQLLRIADYYLDGVFNPMIYTEERLYKREAWRYSLESADAPLTLTGTVYNEMRGNEVIQNAAMYDLLDALFPNSIQSNVNGGDPDVIPEMTWQDLTDFHDTYYHPSNALVMLYGDMDYTRFLELMDTEYFSKYDRKEIKVETGDVPAQTALVERVEEFPVEAGSPTEDASIIQYAFVANDISLEEALDLSMLSGVLAHDASPLKEAVRKALPGATFMVAADINRPDPYIEFYVEGVDEGDMETFRAIVDDTLVQMAEEGINKDILDAIIAAEEFSLLMTPEVTNMGVNLSLSTMLAWSVWDTTEFYNMYLDRLDTIKAELDNGYFEKLIERYLLDNPHAALVATIPAPGKAEEKAAQLAETLAAKKAEMSEEEIAEIVAETAALEQWSQEPAPKELLEKLTAVTADTLPEEVREYSIVEDEKDGIATKTAEASVGAIGSTSIYMDTSSVPQDMLHYLNLYTSLLGEVDTEKHTREELQTLITRYLNGFSTSAMGIRFEDESFRPVLEVSWMSLMDEYETGLDLASEIFFHSKLDDLDMIQNIIGLEKVGLRNQINNNSYIIQVGRVGGAKHEDAAYGSYMTGLEYYDFLSKAEAMVADDPETLISSLEAVQEIVANRQNALAMFGGNEESVQTFDDTILSFFDGVEAKDAAPAAYEFDKPAMREGIVVDSSVQYNLIFDSLEDLGIEYSGKLQPLSQVIYESYIIPAVRHGIGAYDSIVSFSRDGIFFVSYRDPSVKETYAVYDGLPEFAANADITQEDLDRYIVSVYSGYALPQGELTGAMNALVSRFFGRPDNEKQIRMQEIKSTTVQDLHDLAPVFETLLEKGLRSTSGGAAVINENADMFDNIVTVQTKDASAAE